MKSSSAGSSSACASCRRLCEDGAVTVVSVAVLCSTDETYPALVPPCAQALKAAAKPPFVVLAGLPGTPELQAQFKAAGVDEFIHIRANCAKVLAGILNQIGL